MRSIISTADGCSSSASWVAAIAPSSESKCPTANIFAFGSSTSPTVAAVTIASVPSEPTISFGEVERVHAVEPVAARLAPVLRVVLGDRPRVVAQTLDAGVDPALELARGRRASRENVAREPSASTTSSSWTWSIVVP